MKELFINIITNIINYTKKIMAKIENNLKFEENKNLIIKEMYSSILEKKRAERDRLLLELNNIKKQELKLKRKIHLIREENTVYNKKINVLNSFQQFLLSNQG